MAPRKSKQALPARTPVAEWIAAALGLVLTAGVVGFTIWEGLTDDGGPPQLTVAAGRPTPAGGAFVVPIVVRNASHATAAQVEVRGRIAAPGQTPEERRATFSYVPGRGEARGGLMFRTDPRSARLDLEVEGYAEP